MRIRSAVLHIVNDIPLKYKFLLIYLLCVLLPIMTINTFFYQRNSADIQIREQDNLRKSIDRASGELLGMIDEGVALSRSLAGDDSLYEALDRTYDSPIDYYSEYNDLLRDRLTRYVSPKIMEVSIFTNNESIQNGTSYHVFSKTSNNLPWLDRLIQSNGNILVMAYYESGGLYPGKRISIVSKMNNYAQYSSYAKYLRIDLNIDKMDNILNRELDSLQLRLVDDQNQVVAASAGIAEPDAPITHNPPLSSIDVRSGYAMERAIGEYSYVKGWKLVGIADTRRIDQLLNDSQRFIIWLAVISTVAPSLLIFIILLSYHYRVKKLSRHMEKVRNERFDLIDIKEGRDEIGGLIRTFNVMISKITSLINDVYKLEIRQKSLELERVRTELSMLQSQVNPHFLFNTLNALLVVCTKKGYSDVTEIIKNLSLLMRQLLSRVDDLVPLREELELTSMYLQIEKFRFGHLFNYTFDIDPQALSLRIPRMSIQPLVENACKHGLQARKDNRTILVTARLNERDLAVNVVDNGVGMEKGRLQQIMNNMRSDTRTDDHIGIRNVYRRLELFYKGIVRFHINSDPDKGTEAGFHIPLSQLKADEWKKEA
ncbi:two-component system sensor histidine kinase YesM [Paenibacillus cellulosilyticus]|uniref:Two-component system sensor histidine kinase YesM n=1 Tax=Paenibacillus cellulosilyticus TaxID=375489 RepID=A0A2V2YY42_9BACL|nr:sensor histidine kinase [Paenibacillus cellulosilyticus]PWW07183.1 two-component system sensor histidine kinase YesM [Paenibacillus cellulosilyticus]QKS44614.1 sensor histidine kinase [Paenibacillus cellulosilyticus]